MEPSNYDEIPLRKILHSPLSEVQESWWNKANGDAQQTRK